MFNKTQGQVILAYLKKRKFITAQMAWQKFNFTRLSAIIKRLRDAGFEIDSKERDEYNFVKYKLIK